MFTWYQPSLAITEWRYQIQLCTKFANHPPGIKLLETGLDMCADSIHEINVVWS